jgi:hypothetical protein
MNRLALSLATLSLLASCECEFVMAADLPAKPPLKATPIAKPGGPFYIGLFGGGGWSKVENELTIDGTSQGPIKAFPTGVLVGAELGIRWNTPLVWGLNASFAYDFNKQSVGCGPDVAALTGNQCLGFRKDGWLFQQGGEVGINLATLAGFVPGSASPANWPVPITVPASVWSNLTVTARGGIAERDLTLCATAIAATETTMAIGQQCGSKFVIGPYFGGRIGAAISPQAEVFARVDRIIWNSSFTPAQDPRVSAVFANTTRAKDETVAVVGFDYHF